MSKFDTGFPIGGNPTPHPCGCFYDEAHGHGDARRYPSVSDGWLLFDMNSGNLVGWYPTRDAARRAHLPTRIVRRGPRTPMTPYYADESVVIYHGDCLDVGPRLGLVPHALVTDPPYGMGWDNKVSIGRNGNYVTGTRARRYGERVVGDDKPFDPTPWLDYEHVILWGSNHYGERLPVGTTLVWVKRNDTAFGSYLSDAEIAWEKGGHGVYCYRDTGYKTEPDRHHPTQKPIALMRWCIARTSGLVLDPYMGSGTTLVAAKSLGRKAIGIEIEERYCEIAAQRCSQEVLGLSA